MTESPGVCLTCTGLDARGVTDPEERSDAHTLCVSVKFVVNGEEIPVKTDLFLTLRFSCEKALRKSGNVYRPVDHWAVRNESGSLLSMDAMPEMLGIQAGERLFLSLRFAAGDCDAP